MTHQTALVTGGTGFIGSHTVVELLEQNYDIVIIDNLSNSSEKVIDHILQITKVDKSRITFYNYDLLDISLIDEVLDKHNIDFVIHFAALKAVGESVTHPVMYYRNNLNGLMNLLDSMERHKIFKIIFSSSATVYGDPETVPVSEDTPLQKPSNPYGQTKVMVEQILTDFSKVHPDASVVLLRYFNPIGAHKSGLIGESPLGFPTNLMPILMRHLSGKLPVLSVFGSDYDTRDGTCIRDYLHVVDLAKGHVAALKVLKNAYGTNIYNLGTGKGSTVLEVIHAMEKASGRKIEYKMVDRRPGDVPVIYAECKKAEKELGWKTELDLEQMCEDSWRFLQTFPNGI
ncbi:UDP-glucose 4-epimerase, putative [Entamoeba invadens IP1]|uniref:UDP-glucose 4-epimerase n=2 Tax=Entamoeba invadens TaxID=33085 RepID=A0A0A1U0Q5_ENTIV|nr:UDP-glucose 4-epimerase, putative [Entamoeba invadens IP1]ELP87457.1 UDP-glucose 4-epimerase, putative [Entamoeba invadens IP1]BAN40418.1 UDP-glucose 4-epimerase, putative [Entamoeba invadens]BAN41171.1 UDP-glucose 4-epimerase, putative [Entamoeba invadens]BAN42065.1 UDP-glucose 4-epimerase, putative [Entamoeba invadens]|eukprot:XP_004254228.1 UDP-glucose 4-epimerase, putative [Entamoeba invadens IP1]